MAVAVDLGHRCGLINGAWLSTDGQLAPSYSRYKGCSSACQGCHALPIHEAGRQELRHQLQSGAKRLQLTCPLPDVVKKVRAATATTGTPRDPTVSLLEREAVCDAKASTSDRQQVAALLELPQDQLPPVRLNWCHMHTTPHGDLLGRCPKGPSDLEAKIGSHIDTKDPSKKERLCGSCHLHTTDLNRALGLELPLGHPT